MADAPRQPRPHDRESSRSPSPALWLGLALLVLAIAIASQFRLRAAPDASLPTAPFDALESLARSQPLNVVFVLVDTLRSDRLSSYGYERPTSPWIDSLARRGIRFAQVEAQSSWTKASMASIWTSLRPGRHAVERFDHALSDGLRTPAEILAGRGYRTIGIWRNGWVAPTFGFDRGFDLYHRPLPGRAAQSARRADPTRAKLEGSDLDITRSAVAFLRGAGAEPFLLYLHYMDVHQYVSTDDSPDFGTGLSDLYDSAIHWTDRNVGVLIEALAATGLLERTLIVVASDHGEAFGEHGLEGHARSLHRETQQTPLVLALPFALTRGLVVDEPVANVDIWPTLFDLLEQPVPSGLDGESLVPLIRRAASPSAHPPHGLRGLRARRHVAELDLAWARPDQAARPLASLRRGSVRLLWHRYGDGRLELYDEGPGADAGLDRALLEPRRAESLRAELRSILDASTPAPTPLRVDVDPGSRARLRALGYAASDHDPLPEAPPPTEHSGQDAAAATD